jgi:tRNA-specific 2-thiouridylase
LKTGRHFRLESGAKLVVGRNKEENERVERLLLENDIFLEPTNVMGPGALLRTTSEPTADLQTAAAIVTSYCDGDGDKVTVSTKCGETTGSIECERTDRSEWTQVAV